MFYPFSSKFARGCQALGLDVFCYACYAPMLLCYAMHMPHTHTSIYLHNGWMFYREPIDIIIGWTVSVLMDVLVVDV